MNKSHNFEIGQETLPFYYELFGKTIFKRLAKL